MISQARIVWRDKTGCGPCPPFRLPPPRFFPRLLRFLSDMVFSFSRSLPFLHTPITDNIKSWSCPCIAGWIGKATALFFFGKALTSSRLSGALGHHPCICQVRLFLPRLCGTAMRAELAGLAFSLPCLLPFFLRPGILRELMRGCVRQGFYGPSGKSGAFFACICTRAASSGG